jgi:hypothetical protein
MAVALCRVVNASTFAGAPSMTVNASAIRASMVATFRSTANRTRATDLVYRWGVAVQAAGTPYDLQRATFYDIDANAVTCVNLSAFSRAES